MKTFPGVAVMEKRAFRDTMKILTFVDGSENLPSAIVFAPSALLKFEISNDVNFKIAWKKSSKKSQMLNLLSVLT